MIPAAAIHSMLASKIEPSSSVKVPSSSPGEGGGAVVVVVVVVVVVEVVGGGAVSKSNT